MVDRLYDGMGLEVLAAFKIVTTGAGHAADALVVVQFNLKRQFGLSG